MGKKKLAKLRGKIKHIIKSAKSGARVKIRNNDLKKAYRIINRCDVGINIDQSDISYRTMKIIDMIISERNKIQTKEMRKMKQRMSKVR